MKPFLAAFPLMLAAAFAQACAASPKTGEAVAEPPLGGTYVVTRVNQAEPRIGFEGHEPTVTISEDGIHFQSQCIYRDWSYTSDDETIATGPWNYGDQIVGMCARANMPDEEAIIAAIEASEKVRRVGAELHLSGAGGTVIMRRVPAPEEVGARDVDLSGRWTVIEIDGKRPAAPIALVADRETITWLPGCAGQYRDYALDGSGFATKARTTERIGVCRIGLPEGLPELWAVLDAADTIEQASDGTVRISGGGRSLRLVSQAEAAR